MANGKLKPFINLNQSKHHCYTLSTTCTLFKLASEVGPRTIVNSAPAYRVYVPQSATLVPVSAIRTLLMEATYKHIFVI